MSNRSKPDLDRAQDRLPKFQGARHTRPCDCKDIVEALKAVGLRPGSGFLSYAVTRYVLGEDSPEWLAIAEQWQDFDKESFMGGPIGTSPEHIEKAIYGSTSFSHIEALLAALKEVTGQEFHPARDPDMDKVCLERERLLAALRDALMSGKAFEVGFKEDLWRQDAWAIGKPERADQDSLSIQQIDSDPSFLEVEVTWEFHGVPVPVARAIALGSLYSIVLDGRPYTWTYRECKVGRKRLRLVRLSKDVKAYIKWLAHSYLCSRSAS